MNESIRLATKAQAQAVREYLTTLGVDITHTQALEVIARGEGRRSRHAPSLAAPEQAPVTIAEEPNRGISQVATEVIYRYTDAYNCQRKARVVFAGRLRREQLKYILSRLDDGEYFIAAQVGLPCLTHAFNDLLEVQSVWHSLKLWPESKWEVDEDGYVLDAGAIRVIEIGQEEASTVTFDADNLFLRFARLHRWDEKRYMELALERWKDLAYELNPAVGLSLVRRTHPELASFQDELLEPVAQLLLRGKFFLRDKEFHLTVARNAYIHAKFVVQEGQLFLDMDASTLSGEYLTETALIPLQEDSEKPNLQAVLERIDIIRRKVLPDPQAWASPY